MDNARTAAQIWSDWVRSALALTVPLWAVAAGAAVLAVLAAVLLLARRRRAAAPDKTAPAAVTHIQVGKLHRQGARESQQDCFAVSDQDLLSSHGLLAVVADGMGGLADGDKVSQTVVQTVLDVFLAARGRSEPERLLLLLAQSAVDAVGQFLGPERLRSSGSTLVLTLIREGMLWFLGVGDSRVCLYRGGALLQLNREHIFQRTLALRAVNGEITISEAYASEKGCGLTSYLGMGPLKQVDLPAGPIRLLPGDRVVLMSDGVYNALSEQELTDALSLPPEEAARAIETAIEDKAYENQDNFTAVILGCGAAAREDGRASAAGETDDA